MCPAKLLRPSFYGQFQVFAPKSRSWCCFKPKKSQVRQNTTQPVSPLNFWAWAPYQDSAGHRAALLQCMEHSWRFQPFGFGQFYTPPQFESWEKHYPAPADPSLAGRDWQELLLHGESVHGPSGASGRVSLTERFIQGISNLLLQSVG